MQKGYWEDGSKLQFDGIVTATAETECGLVVRFEKTFFYPECGGQLADGGTVGGTTILDAHRMTPVHMSSYLRDPLLRLVSICSASSTPRDGVVTRSCIRLSTF